MDFIFLAIEKTDEQTLKLDLMSLCGVDDKDLVVVCGDNKHRMFKHFNMVADLYIWTKKYHYGTPERKLVYARIKNQTSLSAFFAIKYTNKLRLAIKSKSASIVDPSKVSLLQETFSIGLGYFHNERIDAITPNMKILECEWQVLVSNKNTYPH